MTTEDGVRESSFDAFSPPSELTFEDFFRTNYALLVRSLSVACGPEAAADAAQEAFVQANLRWSQVSELDVPGAWVRRVAVNRVIDAQRHERRGEAAREKLPAEFAAELSPSDLDLFDAVGELPYKQRLAVTLYYLHDLPVDEVASLLDATPGTVKRNLFDARKRLARHLGGSHGS